MSSLFEVMAICSRTILAHDCSNENGAIGPEDQ